MVTLNPGNVLVKKGEAWDKLVIIADGALSLEGPGVAPVLGRGRWFGAASVMVETHSRAEVKALTRCKLLTIRKSSFHRLVKIRPWLGTILLTRIGMRLAEVMKGADFPSDESETPVVF